MTDHQQPVATPPDGPAPALVLQQPFIRRISPPLFVTLSLISIFVIYQIIGGGAILLITGLDPGPGYVTVIRWCTLLGQVLFLLVPTLVLTRMRYGKIVEPLRIRPFGIVQLLLVIGATLAMQQALQGYQLLQDAIPLPAAIEKILIPVKQAMEAMLRLLLTTYGTGDFILVLATVAIVPSIAEEILFRGLVQGDLERVMSGWRSALIAGVTFSLFHLNPFLLVPIIFMGVFLGWVIHRSGSILLAMAAHLVNNAMAAIAIRVGLADDVLVIAPQGAASAAIVALNSAIAVVVFVALMWYFNRITRKPVHV